MAWPHFPDCFARHVPKVIPREGEIEIFPPVETRIARIAPARVPSFVLLPAIRQVLFLAVLPGNGLPSLAAGYTNACMIKADGERRTWLFPSLPSRKWSWPPLHCPLARSFARRNSCGQRVHRTIEGFLAVAVLQLPAKLAFPAPSEGRREGGGASGGRTRWATRTYTSCHAETGPARPKRHYTDNAHEIKRQSQSRHIPLKTSTIPIFTLHEEGAEGVYLLARSPRHEIWIQGRLIVADEMTIIRSTPEEREGEGAGERAYASGRGSDDDALLLAKAPSL